MSESPLTYEDALAWIADHPIGDLKAFAGQAHQLGDRSLPAMVEVLGRGNNDQHGVAASVWSSTEPPSSRRVILRRTSSTT